MNNQFLGVTANNHGREGASQQEWVLQNQRKGAAGGPSRRWAPPATSSLEGSMTLPRSRVGSSEAPPHPPSLACDLSVSVIATKQATVLHSHLRLSRNCGCTSYTEEPPLSHLASFLAPAPHSCSFLLPSGEPSGRRASRGPEHSRNPEPRRTKPAAQPAQLVITFWATCLWLCQPVPRASVFPAP